MLIKEKASKAKIIILLFGVADLQSHQAPMVKIADI